MTDEAEPLPEDVAEWPDHKLVEAMKCIVAPWARDIQEEAMGRIRRRRAALTQIRDLYTGGSGDSQIDLSTAETIARRALEATP